MRRLWWIGCLAACAGESGVDTVPTGECAPAVEPVLQFAADLAEGSMADGDAISYGTPPQGGAPYAPFQIRVNGDVPLDGRFPIVATAITTDDGEEIGSVAQDQQFFCSNTGIHEGWLYGGEVHVRFWDQALEDLEGREITVSMHLPSNVEAGLDFELIQEATGTLTWDL